MSVSATEHAPWILAKVQCFSRYPKALALEDRDRCDRGREHRRDGHNRASWPVLRQGACLGRHRPMLFDESSRRIAVASARPNSHYQAGRHRPPGAGGFRHCTRDEDVPAGPRVSTSPQSTADRIGRTEATEPDSQGHVHSLESRHLGTRHTGHPC